MAKQANGPSLMEHITDAFLVLLLTVYLFWFDGEGFVGIGAAKWRLFCVLAFGYVGGMLLLSAEMCLVGGRRPTLRPWTPQKWFVVAYLALTVLSAVFSAYPKLALLGAARHEGALTICLYGLILLLAAMFGRPKRWHVWLLAGVTALQCVLCIWQMHGANPLGLYPEGVTYFDAGKRYSGEYLGTIGNSNRVGAFLSLSLGLLTAALLRMEGKRRFLLLPVLALGLFTVLKMWVLSCIDGIAGGLLLASPVILPVGRRARRMIALAELGCVLAAAAVVFFVPFRGGMLQDVHMALHGNVPRSVDSGRLYIWKNVLERVPRHPLLGTGPDTMGLSDIKPFERVDDAAKVVYRGTIDAAHNEYLNILYHQGIPALAAYLGALVLLAVQWVRAAQKNAAAAILGTAALCYAIQAFFNISMYLVTPYFWLVLGLLEAQCQHDRTSGRSSRRLRTARSPRTPPAHAAGS